MGRYGRKANDWTGCITMAKIKDICRHIRSKNAGPFWVTIDFFFDEDKPYRRYRDSPLLGPELFERLFGTDPSAVKRFAVDSLKMVKISYPRAKPQGWWGERDMHSGQQFARLLDIDIG
jgi:hypothetical protein